MFHASHVSDSPCKSIAQADGASKKWSRLRRLGLQAASLMLVVSGFSGCTTVHNGFEAITNNGSWNETVLVLRNRSFSAKAWHRRKHNFCREKYIKDFCAGFRSGYEDVAQGGGECSPAFAPQEYWSWEFQSAEGQSRTSAWMAGWPHGARAAEEDGVASWTQLQLSPELQAQYQQDGTFEHQGALYPIPQDQSYMGQVYAPAEPVYSDIPDNQPVLLPGNGELVPPAPTATDAGIGAGLFDSGQ